MSRPLAVTRLMVAVTWISFGAALTYALLPEPAGTLGTLLIGAVGLTGLRGPTWAALAAGALGAAVVISAGVALAIVRMDPTAALAGSNAALASPVIRDPATWVPALAGGALVLGAAPLAGWAAAGVAGRARGPRRAGIGGRGDEAYAMALLDEALATFPADGPALREVLDRLERDLAHCRAGSAPGAEPQRAPTKSWASSR